jgi:hypothetical protein
MMMRQFKAGAMGCMALWARGTALAVTALMCTCSASLNHLDGVRGSGTAMYTPAMIYMSSEEH